MQLGIGTYTFPWAFGVPGYPHPKKILGVFDLLRKAKSLGVNVIQICDNAPLHLMSEGTLNRFQAARKDSALFIEIGTVGVDPRRLLRYLDIAELLHAKIIRTTIHSPDNRPDMGEAERCLRKVVPSLEKRGISVAVENHERYRSKDLIKMVEVIGSPNVGICLDTANSLGALELPEQTVSELMPYALSLHVKDFVIVRADHRMGFVVEGRPAGKGLLNLDWLFETVKKGGSDPNAILELWTPFCGTIEATLAKENKWAAESVTDLRRRIG